MVHEVKDFKRKNEIGFIYCGMKKNYKDFIINFKEKQMVYYGYLDGNDIGRFLKILSEKMEVFDNFVGKEVY